jgi:large subunit ribosomal protein L19
MNKVQLIEQLELRKDIPQFRAGDKLKVHVRIREGEKERVQVFEGICIRRHNDSVRSSFCVRKVSYGEGVERIFPLHSPRLDRIEIVSRGRVRRARLYYLRALRGKAARIRELR